MRIQICCSWYVLLVAMSVASGCGQSTSDVARAIRSMSPDQAKMDRQALFGRASESRLRKLSSHPHNTIALGAAWERVRRTIVEDEFSQHVTPDAEALREFTEIVKARAGPVPKWWEETILGAYTYGDSDVFFSKDPDNWPFESSEAGLQVPRNMSVKRIDDEFLVIVGNEEARVSADLIEIYIPGYEGISALLTKDRCFLAHHVDVSDPYDLTCIDRVDGTVIWTARVWAAPYGVGTLGPIPVWHSVTLVQRQGELVVSGLGFYGAYVEGFNMNDGSNTFRFSTRY